MFKRKICVIGTGFVGSSLVYSLLNQNRLSINEIVLIDVNEEKATGEMMDLSQGAVFNQSHTKVLVGHYPDCKDADIAVITAGISSSTKIQDRLDFTKANTKIFKEITKEVVSSGFQGIFIVASNPVDLMTYVVKHVSQFPKEKVIGTGTLLDTARLQHFIGEAFHVSADAVQAYVLGEHGNSCFIPWSYCTIGNRSMLQLLASQHCSLTQLDQLYFKTKEAGFEIAARKTTTYYAIGMAINRIITAIYQNENVILPVSCFLDGQYQANDICLGVPAIIHQNGIQEIISLSLSKQESQKMLESYHILKEIKEKQVLPILLEKDAN